MLTQGFDRILTKTYDLALLERGNILSETLIKEDLSAQSISRLVVRERHHIIYESRVLRNSTYLFVKEVVSG